jgi:hypothetical protein
MPVSEAVFSIGFLTKMLFAFLMDPAALHVFLILFA